jgi:glycosyltransferase involved in cell wall biosynthesis
LNAFYIKNKKETLFIIHDQFFIILACKSRNSEYTVFSMISVILPTYNEALNIATLIDFLDGVLRDQPHEIIVVDDDSPDGTWQVAESLRAKYQSVRVLRRRDKKGLSSAVVDGFDAAEGSTLVVMDADGQHDPDVLPKVLAAIDDGASIAIGSRYIAGGSVGDWVRDRRIISRVGTFFARVAVSDPLGGFFAIRRSLYRSVRAELKPTGFKILLEILAFIPEKTVLTEVPLQFRMRQHGVSKLSLRVHGAFLLQVLRLFFLQIPRFMHRHAYPILILVSIIIASLCIAQILSLMPLRDPDLRSRVQVAIQTVADHQGWLLSDVTLVTVGDTQATLQYREHRRTDMSSLRCVLTYDPPILSCDTAP